MPVKHKWCVHLCAHTWQMYVLWGSPGTSNLLTQAPILSTFPLALGVRSATVPLRSPAHWASAPLTLPSPHLQFSFCNSKTLPFLNISPRLQFPLLCLFLKNKNYRKNPSQKQGKMLFSVHSPLVLNGNHLFPRPLTWSTHRWNSNFSSC